MNKIQHYSRLLPLGFEFHLLNPIDIANLICLLMQEVFAMAQIAGF
jgi:hypothetical protein